MSLPSALIGRPAPPPKRRRRRARKSRLGLWTGLALFLLVGAYIGVLEYSRPHVSGDRLRYDQFFNMAEGGRLRDATLLQEDSYAVGSYTRDDGSVARYNVPLAKEMHPSPTEVLLENDVPIIIEQQVGKRVASLASMLVPGLILTLLFVYLIISYRRGSGLFSVRSGARRIHAEEAGATFADVAGQDAAVRELREVKDFLSDPHRYTALGATMPKGILLFGPPGCGKTLLARALAGEASASFFSISGSDFVELYAGVGASRVRDLFREAREHVPAVIFIDELDSIGRARGAREADTEQEQALNQVLSEMDGCSPAEGLVVLAATNRPDVLDPALLRPGRFDRSIGLERPDEAGRLAILSLHVERKRVAAGVDLASIASRAIGFTGADLASVVNDAALLSARAGKDAVGPEELDQALQRVLEAPERQRRLSLRDRGVARRYSAHERVTFADVAGVDDAVAELAEVKDYLAAPDRFMRLGARIPRGILISGPPGSGKTLLARAVAGEANAAFFSVAASEFVEVFVGEGASRVRDLFAEARSVSPAIVFIDEIDSVGSRRGVSLDGARDRDQTLNQILVELDGFEAQTGVIVIAATNRPDILDPALVRAQRFDRHVVLSLPDRAGRAAIAALYLRNVPVEPDVDVDTIAELTRGFSGADLANVVNEAALLAARHGATTVDMTLVEEAVQRAMTGVASRGSLLGERDREMMAYHVAGHALVARAVLDVRPSRRVSIVAHAPAAGKCGVTERLFDNGAVTSRSALFELLVVLLAGREAERLVFTDALSAAAGDLAHGGEIARSMVCQLGMSDRLAHLPYSYADPSSSPLAGGAVYSEETGQAIESEICRIMDDASQRAHTILAGARSPLDRVAKTLLERETLGARELDELLGVVPLPGGGHGSGSSEQGSEVAARRSRQRR